MMSYANTSGDFRNITPIKAHHNFILDIQLLNSNKLSVKTDAPNDTNV